MAITRQLTAVTFASPILGDPTGGEQKTESNVVTLEANCINAQIHLSASNAGAASALDVVDFYVIQTGNTTYDGDNATHAVLLGTVDTTVGNEQITRPIEIPQAGLKIVAIRPQGGSTNGITVSAEITEQLAA